MGIETRYYQPIDENDRFHHIFHILAWAFHQHGNQVYALIQQQIAQYRIDTLFYKKS